MKILESFMTENPCFKRNEPLEPQGITLQILGRPQPSAKVMVHNWNRETQTDICPHVFIDSRSGEVYQTLPFNVKGKHAGTSLNSRTIGIMICEPIGVKHSKGEIVLASDLTEVQAMVYATWNAAVELSAILCEQYKINPLNRIYSYHKRSPEKLWKFLNVPPTMQEFRSNVLLKMAELKPVSRKPIRVLVEYPNLRIRTGPGSEYDSIGKFTGAGEFTLSEIQNGSGSSNGWGKLDSGEGWISLDFVKFL